MVNAIIDELMIWNSVALTAEQVADAFFALGENLLVVHNVRDGMTYTNQSELLLRQYPRRGPGSVAHQTNQCPKPNSMIRSRNVNRQLGVQAFTEGEPNQDVSSGVS